MVSLRPSHTRLFTFSALPQLVGDGKTIAHAAVYAFRDSVMGYSPSFYLACAEVCLPRPLRCANSIVLPLELYHQLAAHPPALPRNAYTHLLNQNPSYDYAGEVNALAAAVGNPSLAQASGIKAGGVKYMFIRSHVQDQSADPFLAGNKGGAGISVRQTKAVILVAISAPGAAGALLVSASVFHAQIICLPPPMCHRSSHIVISLHHVARLPFVLSVQCDIQLYKAAQSLIAANS
jgi:hypothetical protein